MPFHDHFPHRPTEGPSEETAAVGNVNLPPEALSHSFGGGGPFKGRTRRRRGQNDEEPSDGRVPFYSLWLDRNCPLACRESMGCFALPPSSVPFHPWRCWLPTTTICFPIGQMRPEREREFRPARSFARFPLSPSQIPSLFYMDGCARAGFQKQ